MQLVQQKELFDNSVQARCYTVLKTRQLNYSVIKFLNYTYH